MPHLLERKPAASGALRATTAPRISVIAPASGPSETTSVTGARTIKATFDAMFERVPFVAPAVVVERRRPWRIWSGSSRIDFVFGRSETQEYLEYCAVSKFAWGTQRGRIFDDGSVEQLEGEQDAVIFDPNVPDAAEDQEQRMREHNARVVRDMAAAGFHDGPDHSLFADALAQLAAALTDALPNLTASKRPESLFRLILKRALEQEVGELVELEKRLDLGDRWPNLPPRKLGGVDLLVRYQPPQKTLGRPAEREQWRYVAELKWSESPPRSPKVYEVLWDALKMLAAAQTPYVEAAYIVTAARTAEWEKPAHCAELFTAGTWAVKELLDMYPSDWRFLLQEGGPPPRRLPATFRTAPISEIADDDFIVRAAHVSCDFFPEDWVDFDNGSLLD